MPNVRGQPRSKRRSWLADRALKGKTKAQPVATPTVAAATEESASLVMAPQERELIAKLKELRDHVLKNADNVGTKFPDPTTLRARVLCPDKVISLYHVDILMGQGHNTWIVLWCRM